MATNYAPTVNQGDTRSRIRATRAENENDMALPPEKRAAMKRRMQFMEEKVVRLADGTEASLGGTRHLVLDYNPDEMMPLKNPVGDGTLTIPGLGSSIPMSLAFVILYTLGRYAQYKGDLEDEKRAADLAKHSITGP